MTFMRKILDLMNMDNWHDDSVKASSSNPDSTLETSEHEIPPEELNYIVSHYGSSPKVCPSVPIDHSITESNNNESDYADDKTINTETATRQAEKSPIPNCTQGTQTNGNANLSANLSGKRTVSDAFLWQCNSIAELRDSSDVPDYAVNHKTPESGYQDAIEDVVNDKYGRKDTTDTNLLGQANPTNNISVREFDLNIEKILENWEVYHAIREIIANAIDEQVLTNTKDIEITQSADGWWHIKDSGRGINYHHLTQNENEEKLHNPKLIGRFGVGLKDSLATLYRHSIEVRIKSKYGIITLKTAAKVGFDDISTLHAEIFPPDEPNIVGTDFGLYGCTQKDVEKAKSLFLKFTNDTILETTRYGQVIDNHGGDSSIYINGVKVAQEPNFLFSYNITSINAQIRKSLNRERTNVGRTAYTSRIKDILQECSSDKVITKLIDDLQEMTSGNRHDELTWNDVAMHASINMRKLHPMTLFISTSDLQNSPSLIDKMKIDGHNLVIVPDNLIAKMDDYNTNAENDEVLTTPNQYLLNEEKNFTPIIIDKNALSIEEQRIYDQTEKILHLIGGLPKNVFNIQIVEKIYDEEIFSNTVGLWIPSSGCILIKRSQLCNLASYSRTLLHECAHAISGADDVSRDFEHQLTIFLGILAATALNK